MDLIQFLKRNENARKIFGKRELIIIKKQLLGVRLTQSEKNRLSRDIRKKLEFIKEISSYGADFQLKKGSKIKEEINYIKEHILDSEYSLRIKKIYLFGSTVDNLRTLRSDIDIAVEFDEIDAEKAVKFEIKFSYNEKIDVKVYNILPEKIKKEVDEKGKVIYERKNK